MKISTILHPRNHSATVFFLVFALFTSACSQKQGEEEQISVPDQDAEADTLNSIGNNLSLSQIGSKPNHVVLTGLAQHRLVTVYKIVEEKGTFKSYDYDDYQDEVDRFFMPGIDLLYGYNLLNIAHYDLTTEQLNFLFDHPVLVKSLYYPSFVQDSLDHKPINRDYYLVSAYDADTNADTLINKSDLRRFYHFNAAGSDKTQLIPADYSVVRSEYDRKNDVMYVFAQQDENKNGMIDKSEPLHIFWLNLKAPAKAKRLY
jgi:hypothetical protein